MKIKVRTLRKMIREALGDVYQAEPDPFGSRFAKPDEEPKTMRGGVGMPAPTSDEFESGVPTQRGMNLEPTIEDLFGGWDEHVGTDVLFDDVKPATPAVEPAKVEVPAKKRSHKKKPQAPKVGESSEDLSPNRNQDKDTQYPRK